MKIHATLFLAQLIAAAHAGPRSSANYSVPAEVTSSGGGTSTSSNYTNDASTGGVVGISTVASPDQTAKAGYIAQLYDATALTLTGPSQVNEGATAQLEALLELDDSTLLSLSPASVTWSVVSGPLTGINSSGLATAGTVFQHTVATAGGSYLDFTATLGLSVRNVNLDNFGSYAGDNLDDAWQNQFFGLNNPSAAPTLDPDGDGQTNVFEFTAGLVPTNPLSRLTLRLDAVSGQPAQKRIVFFPIVAGRTYAVQSRLSLMSDIWQTLTGTTQSDTGSERTVTDLNATDAQKLYRVQVNKP